MYPIHPRHYEALKRYYNHPLVRLRYWWDQRHNRRWKRRFFKRYPL